MAQSTKHLGIILNLNGRLFINALEGVSEAQAKDRISDHNNPLNWIATHTVWGRYMMCALLGKPADKNPYEGMFENFKPFGDDTVLPSLSDVKTEWQKATDLLTDALSAATDEHLASEAPMPNPTGDFSIGGTIAFLAQHESYDLGQMAFLKKYLTKEAMKY